MNIYRFESKQKLKISISEAWEFFSNANNLTVITPPWLNFDIQTRVDEKMYAGMIIKYKVKPLLNIPMTWVTEITHVEELKFFVDEQRFGPYKFWHHKHIFNKVDSGVEMVDIVDYMLPFSSATGFDKQIYCIKKDSANF